MYQDDADRGKTDEMDQGAGTPSDSRRLRRARRRRDRSVPHARRVRQVRRVHPPVVLHRNRSALRRDRRRVNHERPTR